MSIRRAIIICFFVSLGFNSSVLAAADEPEIIPAAKREGRVVWYTVAGESQQLAQEFERKYPFVKVEVVRSTVYPLLTRILNEARAGNYLFDVVRQSTFTIGVLIQRGLMQPYESPERKGYNTGWKDNQGYWTSTDDNYFVVGYNTRLVSEREAPKGWEDLLLPKWRGQITLDPDNHILFGGLEQSWGRERAIVYFRKLAQQHIQFRKGNTLIAQLVVAGEYPLGFVYAHRVEFLKSQKAPIEWVSTMNPIIATGDQWVCRPRRSTPTRENYSSTLFYRRTDNLSSEAFIEFPRGRTSIRSPPSWTPSGSSSCLCLLIWRRKKTIGKSSFAGSSEYRVSVPKYRQTARPDWRTDAAHSGTT